ncbi:MAG: hypothetical protein HYS13_23080 [Planctomycetia bacterium]|nr:hypothetical protein [Planctomycetia bacterium]
MEVACPSCATKLRVPEGSAGKLGRCPKCQNTFTIPAGSDALSVPAEAPEGQAAGVPAESGSPQLPAAAGLAGAAPGPKWRIHTADGQYFGPMTQAELEGWLTDGRLDARAQLYQDGWSTWRWAEDIYPQLHAQAAAAALGAASPAGAAPTAQAAAPFQTNVGAPAGAGAGYLYSPAASGGVAGAAAPLAGVRGWLKRTRRWVIFLAVLGFVFTALSALGTAFSLIGATAAGPFGWLATLYYLGQTAVLFVLSLMMVIYAAGIGEYLRNNSIANLQRAMQAQQRFWMWTAIFTFLGIAGMAFFCLFVAFAMPRGMGM